MLTLSFLISVLVLVLVVWVAFWIIDSIGVPYPVNTIAKAIVGILALVFLLQRAGLLA